MWEAFPDAHLNLEETIASDDRLTARYTVTGIQTQDFGGAAASSKVTKIEAMTWLHFRVGRVAEVWQASGSTDMLTRLSARAAGASTTRHSASADAAALRWEEQHPEP